MIPSTMDNLPATTTEYEARLQRNTFYGAIVSTFFMFLYTVIYLVNGFAIAALINFIGLAACVVADLILVRLHKHRLTAHIFTAALFFTVISSTLISGEINSSSLPWLCFVPIAAMYTTSIRSGVTWALICLAAILGVFFLSGQISQVLSVRPSGSADRLMDTLGLLMVLTAAVAISERVTRETLNKLHDAKQQLQESSIRDPLTHAYNRRFFYEQANHALHANHGSHSTLALFDIDHFKGVNDTFGHLTGDRVLADIVTLCHDLLRPQDVFARFGGEEFIILMPETTLSEALPLIFNLRKKIACQPIHTEKANISITISIGITSTEQEPISLEELIHQADQAVYLAKDGGRNRVVAWHQAEIDHLPCDI